MINNHHEQLIINNNPIIKKNRTNIKTKNNNIIENFAVNLDSKNIEINNIFPETIENNKINNINDININYDNNNNFNYDDIKNNQNMPNDQWNKNIIPINNKEKNNLNNDVNTGLVMNAFNSNDKDVTLYFNFSNRKELYLDVKETDYFSEVKKELYNKYSWLSNINILMVSIFLKIRQSEKMG